MAKLIEQHVHPTHKKLYIQQRSDSKWLQAVAFLDGGKKQFSTKTQHLPTAFRLAEAWYRDKQRIAADEPARKAFEIPIMEELFKSWCGELGGKKLEWAEEKWDGPVAKFWEAKRVSEVGTQMFKEYYRWRRAQKTHYKKKPSNATLHQDVILVRQILKYAVEEGHITTLPLIPFVGEREPNPRPWLTQQEWETLKKASHDRIHECPVGSRLRQQRYELDQQMRFIVESMMRVGEMLALRFRDGRVQKNSKKNWVLVCEVKGKRGIRTVVGRHEAAKIFDERKSEAKSDNELLFPVHHREAFTELLKVANLHIDPLSGFQRNFKSLRCTAISLAVLRGSPSPNLLMIARNAGTSVTMIDSFYARRLSAEMGLDVLTE